MWFDHFSKKYFRIRKGTLVTKVVRLSNMKGPIYMSGV